MKKLLILILIALLLILTFYIGMQGVSFGKVEVLGIKGIQAKSAQLDSKLQEAGKLAEKSYAQAVSDVNSNAKKLKEEKKNYEDMTTISSDGDVQSSNQIEKYELETLYVKLGNHATKEGVVMKMDILQGSSGAQGVYNLNFTVTGGYVQIEDFISSIENDSTLGFKIEEFKMAPSGDTLQATFVCKDVPIKELSSTTSVTPKNQQDGNTAGNTTNAAANATTKSNIATNTTTANNTIAAQAQLKKGNKYGKINYKGINYCIITMFGYNFNFRNIAI